MHGVQKLAGGQLDAAHLGLTLGPLTLQAGAHAHNAHLGHVALQQGVGGLGGAVGDEHHIVRIDVILRQHLADDLDDAFRHALFRVVGGGDLGLGDHLIAAVVDHDGIGEGAAHVDADPNFIAHDSFPFCICKMVSDMRLGETGAPISPKQLVGLIT